MIVLNLKISTGLPSNYKFYTKSHNRSGSPVSRLRDPVDETER